MSSPGQMRNPNMSLSNSILNPDSGTKMPLPVAGPIFYQHAALYTHHATPLRKFLHSHHLFYLIHQSPRLMSQHGSALELGHLVRDVFSSSLSLSLTT
jgi:hypothetical protein